MLGNKKWKEKFIIRSFDADLNGNCKLTSLLQYFQEVAWHHAEYCRFGYFDLLKKNKFWILSGLEIQIHEYPRWEDEIEVATWPKGIDRLFALRDFEMKKNNTLFCKGTTTWLVVDSNTQRIQKPEIVFENFNDFLYQDAIQRRPIKVEENTPNTIASSITARYSDLDVNKHVNNVRYVQWAIDSLPFGLFNKNTVKLFTINFISETRIGDVIHISHSSFEKDNPVIVSAYNSTSKKPAFRIQLGF